MLRQLGKEYGADGIEISAHALCVEDHLPYQGKQYSNKDFEALQASLDRPFGQWNCKHTMYPIILGVSQPANDEATLQQYRENSNALIDIDGRVKTRYQWSQEMRKVETAVRQQKDVANLAKASGDDVARREAQSKINRLQEYYDKLTEKAGIQAEKERMTVSGFRAVKTTEQLKNPFSTLQNATQNGILVVTETRKDHGRAKLKETPNAVIDVVGKKNGISRFIYDTSGTVRYRVDNNDHGYPKEHEFENGEHYHIARWDGSKWVGYSMPNEIPKQLRKMCADILKDGDDHV